MTTYALYDLNEFIRRVLALNLPEPLWITAEIAQHNVNRKHHYLELVQLDPIDGAILAQAAAVIWDKEFERINRASGGTVASVLREGVELRLQVRVDYHERYGLKLTILEIDTAFTFGQLELQRRETLDKLQRLGLLDRNKALPLPRVLQRLAIITSNTAAGFADFAEHLAANPYGYRFKSTLFSAAVQGKNAVGEIMRAFDSLQPEKYDAAIVIRGGGAKLDLAAFDTFELCAAAAQLPIPLLAGIGHEVDETVLDRVAHASLKTPTAVADFIIENNLQFETGVLQLGSSIGHTSALHQRGFSQALDSIHISIRQQAARALHHSGLTLDHLLQSIPRNVTQTLRNHRMALNNAEALLDASDPTRILQRGYALVRHQGAVLTDSAEVRAGDLLDIRLAHGAIKAKTILP